MLKKLFSFCLFYPTRLPTFAPVPRYSVIGQYVLLITRALRYYPSTGNSTLSRKPDNTQHNAHVPFVVISVHGHYYMYMSLDIYR